MGQALMVGEDRFVDPSPLWYTEIILLRITLIIGRSVWPGQPAQFIFGEEMLT